MNKQEFLDQLRARLAGLPEKEVEERIEFYAEMIEDRVEEGMSEEKAVEAIGSVEEIAGQIAGDIPLMKIAKEKIKSGRKLRAWEIVLLAAGSPLWIVLLAAALVIVIALYACAWAVVASLWAAFGALAGCGLGFVAGGIFFMARGMVTAGLTLVSGGLVSAGLAIFAFFGCLWATKGTAILAKVIVVGLKKCFVRKEKSK